MEGISNENINDKEVNYSISNTSISAGTSYQVQNDNKVYYGVRDGEAKYTGITKQTTDARLYQHNKSGKGFTNLDVQYDGLTRNQARAVEQYLIENGPNTFNKINSISPDNKYYKNALEWAKKYINNN